jgi:hypothetical protein
MSIARVLLVMPDPWPRALLRAELRERGYDAQGAPTLAEAMVYPAEEPERGPVRLVIVDGRVLGEGSRGVLERLCERHPEARVVLLWGEERVPPPGPWTGVVRGPFSIDETVRAVQWHIPAPVAPSGLRGR